MIEPAAADVPALIDPAASLDSDALEDLAPAMGGSAMADSAIAYDLDPVEYVAPIVSSAGVLGEAEADAEAKADSAVVETDMVAAALA